MLVGTTPVAENNTIQEALVMVKKTGNFLLDILYYLIFGWQTKIGVAQDLPLFNTIKAEAEVGAAYVKYDLAVLKFRSFYQSWVDKVE
ncbi:Aminopyrrolnitrin oxidase PrnD [Nostoc flagelliforme CCNUN1]|uniref:Aminopyrrolnitrin oxidase PrnD n=1 Tax=Nostoc flagelliforme CCNUN1 TaxID=2038116 RepID=A0A2K8SIU4_9NOSO|nr:hypothetical protein [Nostoc flagelliforme]AUB35394.1 Aminopyrrolnitrin oxidase PrnD [Nostoc flagelliforme CCNUN1]